MALFFLPAYVAAQVQVVKSSDTELIEGKKYYMHEVEKGHTVYSISRAYDVSVDEIYFENPEARDGIQIGDLLRIPVMGRDREISDNLRSGDFNFIFHIVQKGETLYSIGRIYDVSPEELVKANPGADKALKTGQYIRVPVRPHEMKDEGDKPLQKEDDNMLIEHVVASGETLFSIAKKYDFTVKELETVNPGLDTRISPGEIIYIPFIKKEEKEESLPYIQHKVIPKETLYSIAVNYGVSIDSIKILNPGLTSAIQAGQVILIPIKKDQNDFITHRVRSNKRLKKIARMYSLDADEIREINPSAGNRVSQGTILRIPIPPMAGMPVAEPSLPEIPDEVYKLVDADSIRCHQDLDYRDNVFKVALMVPLYLEEADSLPRLSSRNVEEYIESPPFKFIQFYEGMLIAVDSLRKQGLQVDLHVYDVDEKVAKTIKVLQDPALMEMDIIIGPLFRKNFKLVSNYAKLFNINIVNPLTTRDEILDYKHVFKIKPAQRTQLDLAEQVIRRDFAEAKIIIVRQDQFRYGEMANELKNRLERSMQDKVQIANSLLDNIIKEYSILDTTLAEGELIDNLIIENMMIYREFLELQMDDSTSFVNRVDEVVYAEEGIEGVLKRASIIRPTVIVALSDRKVFSLELITRLNEFRDSLQMTIFGFPGWYEFSAMETEYLQNLNTHVLSDSYVDYSDQDVIGFVKQFRRSFYTEPARYAFDGFDTGYYFLGALLKYGRDFEKCVPYNQQKLIQNTYLFRHKRNRGFENQHWNLLKYSNYSVLKLN
jgi:LysM repeat protein